MSSFLRERRVAHAEPGPDVLGDQVDCRAVAHRVGLRQVSHSVDEQALSLDVSRIRSAFAPFIA